jgi:hypothetical protein
MQVYSRISQLLAKKLRQVFVLSLQAPVDIRMKAMPRGNPDGRRK